MRQRSELNRSEVRLAIFLREVQSRRLWQRRPELLSSGAIEPREGKVLLFTPQDSLSEGAATVASEGFFDVDNVPAWDTWLYFDGRSLLSWVPLPIDPESAIRH